MLRDVAVANLISTIPGKLSAAAPEFLCRHPAARGCSRINRSHGVKKSGGGRAFVAAHIALIKSFPAYDFHRLAVGAPDAGAPLSRFLLKCPHDKSLVLHMFTAPKFLMVSQWTGNMAAGNDCVTPPYAGGGKLENDPETTPQSWG